MKIKLIFLFFIFAFTAGAQYTPILNFTGTNGGYPCGSLISDGTFLYGMTYYGGITNGGVIFKVMPDGSGYVKLMDFTGIATGNVPYGSLIYDGTFLYGMVQGSGAYGKGTLIKIKTDGTGYAKLLDFAGTTNGAYPSGSLISDGTFLYGVTNGGGINSNGTMFRIMPDGTGYTKLFDFASATSGNFPKASLISDGTFFYGITDAGGLYNNGTIYKIKPDGTSYSKLLDFSGTTNGSSPKGALLFDGTFLYGTTTWGGIYSKGTLFKIKTDGTGYSRLLDFSGTVNGSEPNGAVISDGTFLYGMTESGGINNLGTVFKIMPDGTNYSKLVDLDSITGIQPLGDFLLIGSTLYGMTNTGGANDQGVIFKYDIIAGILEENLNNELAVFPNPGSGKFTIQLQKGNANAEIAVYDATGKKVYTTFTFMSGSSTVIDLSSVPSGIYFAEIRTGNKIFQKKIIIQ